MRLSRVGWGGLAQRRATRQSSAPLEGTPAAQQLRWPLSTRWPCAPLGSTAPTLPRVQWLVRQRCAPSWRLVLSTSTTAPAPRMASFSTGISSVVCALPASTVLPGPTQPPSALLVTTVRPALGSPCWCRRGSTRLEEHPTLLGARQDTFVPLVLPPPPLAPADTFAPPPPSQMQRCAPSARTAPAASGSSVLHPPSLEEEEESTARGGHHPRWRAPTFRWRWQAPP